MRPPEPLAQETLPAPRLEMIYVHQDTTVSPSLGALIRATRRLGARWLNLILAQPTASSDPGYSPDLTGTRLCIEACSLPAFQKTLSGPAPAVVGGGLDLESLDRAGWELAITCDLGSPMEESFPGLSGFRGVKTASLAVRPDQVPLLPAEVPRLMAVFDRIKFDLVWKDRDGAAAYAPFARALEDLDSLFPGRVLALIPWVFLSHDHLGIGRHVCRYKHTLGLTTSGKVTLCGLPGVVLGELGPSSLAAVWCRAPLLAELRRVDTESFAKPCGICLFRAYCANQCPARVFAQTGSFSSSLPECAVLYEEGLFPEAYVVDHG